MPPAIRSALPTDLSALDALEARLFPPERRESRRGLLRSLKSPAQEVWILKDNKTLLAAMTLRIYPKSLRIYSLGVHPAAQGQGLGRRLIHHAHVRARELSKDRLTLEADADNARLIQTYAHEGFQFVHEIPEYYGPGTRAHRMQKALK